MAWSVNVADELIQKIVSSPVTAQLEPVSVFCRVIYDCGETIILASIAAGVETTESGA